MAQFGVLSARIETILPHKRRHPTRVFNDAGKSRLRRARIQPSKPIVEQSKGATESERLTITLALLKVNAVRGVAGIFSFWGTLHPSAFNVLLSIYG